MPDEYVRIGKSIASPSPANSSTASKLAYTSADGEPRGEPAEQDVLAAGELAVEADAERQQRRDPAPHRDPARGRRQDPGDRAQQRRLARAVAADDAVDRAGRHLEAHAAQRLDQHRPLRAVAQARERALQRLVLLARDAEADPEVVDPDGRAGGQSRTAKSRSRARNTIGAERGRTRRPTPTRREQVPRRRPAAR